MIHAVQSRLLEQYQTTCNDISVIINPYSCPRSLWTKRMKLIYQERCSEIIIDCKDVTKTAYDNNSVVNSQERSTDSTLVTT